MPTLELEDAKQMFHRVRTAVTAHLNYYQASGRVEDEPVVRAWDLVSKLYKSKAPRAKQEAISLARTIVALGAVDRNPSHDIRMAYKGAQNLIDKEESIAICNATNQLSREERNNVTRISLAAQALV